MEGLGLYPAFELPEVYGEDEERKRAYRPAPLFNFETGDFVRDAMGRVAFGDGKAAYEQWCVKMLSTQFSACLAYPDLGVDGEGALVETGRAAIQAALEKAIIEALMHHPATRRVKEFSFEWDSDAVKASFTVESVNWAAFDLEMNVLR